MAKITTEIRSAARGYSDMCLKQLAGIAEHGTNESARVTACCQLLDRGWGKAVQPHAGADGESALEITIRNIIEGKT